MYKMFTSKRKFLGEVMKFSFHHRAFYCYLGMSVWIFFMMTVMYKYMSAEEEAITVKKYTPKSDSKFRKLYMRACNPADSIVRGSEGLIDSETWLLQGVLVLTRHGDRGPLTHLRGGDKIPCDTTPTSPLLKSYEEFVYNSSVGGRAAWSSGAGPFHNFPSLPPRAAGTSCALGQLTPRGLLQMITVGNILRAAYKDKLLLETPDPPGKKDTGAVSLWSTGYRRTFQSLAGAAWGAARGAAAARLGRARDAHSVHFCYAHCACDHAQKIHREMKKLSKHRLESNPGIKKLVTKMSKVLFESEEHADADTVRDAILAYICHDAPLPCSGKPDQNKPNKSLGKHHKKLRQERSPSRGLLEVDIDTLNMELDYINNQLDFNNEIGRKARDIIGKYYDSKDKAKAPLDFDAQMEKEKLQYYQQRYMDNGDSYDDVVIVKKNLDADFNFPNDARMDTDFDEDYKEPTTNEVEDFCIKEEHVVTLFSYLEWSFKQDEESMLSRKRGLLLAYGLIHNMVQNMIRVISENKPKLVIYSGHDKTIQPLILALGLKHYQHYNIRYATRFIIEVYRRRDLRDQFKFAKRKAVAQDFYFRVVYNGDDITNKLSFCRDNNAVLTMTVPDQIDDEKVHDTYLCPIENIVRFIHDDYFAMFNVSNFKDACATNEVKN